MPMPKNDLCLPRSFRFFPLLLALAVLAAGCVLLGFLIGLGIRAGSPEAMGATRDAAATPAAAR